MCSSLKPYANKNCIKNNSPDGKLKNKKLDLWSCAASNSVQEFPSANTCDSHPIVLYLSHLLLLTSSQLFQFHLFEEVQEVWRLVLQERHSRSYPGVIPEVIVEAHTDQIKDKQLPVRMALILLPRNCSRDWRDLRRLRACCLWKVLPVFFWYKPRQWENTGGMYYKAFRSCWAIQCFYLHQIIAETQKNSNIPTTDVTNKNKSLVPILMGFKLPSVMSWKASD